MLSLYPAWRVAKAGSAAKADPSRRCFQMQSDLILHKAEAIGPEVG